MLRHGLFAFRNDFADLDRNPFLIKPTGCSVVIEETFRKIVSRKLFLQFSVEEYVSNVLKSRFFFLHFINIFLMFIKSNSIKFFEPFKIFARNCNTRIQSSIVDPCFKKIFNFLYSISRNA